MNANVSQSNLLHDISVVSFILVDLNLYLDTHPSDQSALELFSHYSRMQSQLTKEYNMRYGPLMASDFDKPLNKWLWVMGPMPWEGVC